MNFTKNTLPITRYVSIGLRGVYYMLSFAEGSVTVTQSLPLRSDFVILPS